MDLIKFIIVLSVLILDIPWTYCQRSDTLSKLVKDIIQNERVPSTLLILTCWSKKDELNFVRDLSIPVQMMKSTPPLNLPVDENTNKQWFFIDMKCERNSEFLSNVDNKYFAHPFRWIIADVTHETIQDLTILPNSNIIIATQKIDSMEYVLKQGNIRKEITQLPFPRVVSISV